MKKNYLQASIAVLLLAGFGLTACGVGGSSTSTGSSSGTSSSDGSSDSSSGTSTSSTGTSSSGAILPTRVDAVNAVSRLLTSSITSYTYTERKYQGNFITGIPYDDYYETIDMNHYSTGYDGTVKHEELTGVYETETTSSFEARFATYAIDDSHWIKGLYSEGCDENYYSINERNMDNTEQSITMDYAVLYNIGLSFYNPGAMWDTSIGFTLLDFEVSEIEDGRFLCTIGATAEADDWYSAEDGSATIILDSDFQVEFVSFGTVLFHGPHSEDLEADVNAVKAYSLSNIVAGELEDTEITPFDIDLFSDSEIYGLIPEVVEVADGELSKDVTTSIVKNLAAYTVGTKSSTVTYHSEENYDAEWNDLGPATVTTECTLYSGFFRENLTTTVFDDPTVDTIDTITQINAAAEGVQVTSKVGDTEPTSYTNDGSYITSMDDYFNVSGIYANMSFSELMSKLPKVGFDVASDEYLYTLIGATKADGTIEIEIKLNYDYVSEWYESHSVTYFKFVIEDDFLSSCAIKSSGEGEYETVTMVKGELEEFKGDVLPYTPSTSEF